MPRSHFHVFIVWKNSYYSEELSLRHNSFAESLCEYRMYQFSLGYISRAVFRTYSNIWDIHFWENSYRLKVWNTPAISQLWLNMNPNFIHMIYMICNNIGMCIYVFFPVFFCFFYFFIHLFLPVYNLLFVRMVTCLRTRLPFEGYPWNALIYVLIFYT